jgi:hypothetical protein
MRVDPTPAVFAMISTKTLPPVSGDAKLRKMYQQWFFESRALLKYKTASTVNISHRGHWESVRRNV